MKDLLKLLCKIDLDLFCLRAYVQRGHYLNFLQYLYFLQCMSPDVTDIPSRMQINPLTTVRLVGEVDTSVVCFIVALDYVLFYLSPILHLVVIYI